MNRVLNMTLILVLGLLLGFVAPATVFHWVEGWHLLEALYFCFTTLSTIGFGDYIIGEKEREREEGGERKREGEREREREGGERGWRAGTCWKPSTAASPHSSPLDLETTL